ncbi:MAG TPA: hypothetical protein VGE54_09500 [Brevundimonas sp.]
MSVTLTLILIAAAVASAVFCGWRGAKPPHPLKVRMAPWRFLMLVSASLVVFLLIHLVWTLSGRSPV